MAPKTDRGASISSYAAVEKNYGSEMRNNIKAFGLFIFNRQKKEFLCRTWKSWLLILTFYFFFLLFLLIIASVLMIIFFVITWRTQPYVSGELNLLRLTPGLQFVPQTDFTKLIFIFSSNINGQIFKSYTETISDFFANITKVDPKSKIASCKPSEGLKVPNSIDYTCPFNTLDFGPCAKPVDQLANGSVCLFVTLNSIFGFLPELLDTNILGPTIQCGGTYEGDNDNLKSISYYPNNNGTGYFSHVYFPYLKQIGYVKPMLALHIVMDRTAVVFIECTVGNIKFFKYKKFGILKSNFEIVLDGPFY